ncbi:SufE-like protein 1, chloroplastic/mitochondrial [Psilocybe cubensis]|uniref:SufE-like protein 1, chloroplastic/mitochondrial n=2 Tax=Psilocybe cubensis TaxID=181762 RepID=A0ACB8HBL9_PSICU|nr:SufE-like protein 1, chloroplastic/mitochondrial [Psilocybe cubensis]KAH9485188.1 SufE-like protein 1, chloroplastic/mitochondrial [Psilocybe cubensis]
MNNLQHARNSPSSSPGPVEISIREKVIMLTALLQPASITITNDSWQHRHHSAMRDQENNGETHFSVQVVSDAFEKKTTMQRHRIVYSALSDEFARGLHALSLKTKTVAEVAASGDGRS